MPADPPSPSPRGVIDPSFLAPLGAVADWRLVLVLDAARSTGMLDALPATAEQVAGRLELVPEATRAVLDALAAAGILRIGEDGVVERGVAFPDDGTAAQLRQHAGTIRRWANGLEPRLRGEGEGDSPPFDLTAWLRSMAVNAAHSAEAVADTAMDALAGSVHRDGRVRVLDLGGGHGRYGAALAARGARVVMQDRPDVVAVVEAEGWLDGTGVELFAGDFHEVLPPGPFDIVLAVGVLHTMAPEQVAALLRRVAAHTAPGGVLLIRTRLRGEGSAGALFAVQMAVSGLGGDTHRREDYGRWLADAGFDPARVTVGDDGATLVARRTLAG